MKKNEIKWLSELQGFSMLTVVIGHVYDKSEWYGGGYESILQSFIYSFHMPLFMFISGFLYNFTKISRNKKMIDIVKEKSVRLLIPYFSFNIITYILKLMLPTLMQRQVELDVNQFIDTFVTLKNLPLYEMWFINALFGIMLLYPLYRGVIHSKILICIFSFFACFLYFLPLNFSFIFSFGKISDYLIYFWGGIVIYEYKDFFLSIYNKQKSLIVILLTFIFVIAQYFHFLFRFDIKLVNLIVAFISISFFIMVFYLVSKKYERLFFTFRDYTYQIFLLGIFFQVGVRVIIFHYLNRNVLSTLFLYLLSIACGIYIPVLISKILLRTNLKPMKILIGL